MRMQDQGECRRAVEGRYNHPGGHGIYEVPGSPEAGDWGMREVKCSLDNCNYNTINKTCGRSEIALVINSEGNLECSEYEGYPPEEILRSIDNDTFNEVIETLQKGVELLNDMQEKWEKAIKFGKQVMLGEVMNIMGKLSQCTWVGLKRGKGFE